MCTTKIRFAFGLLVLAVATSGCSGGDPAASESGGQTPARGSIGKSDSAGSCVGRCGAKSSGNCWCDGQCSQHGDCCEDISTACGLGSGPRITFRNDFSESVSGVLTRGATVEIGYDENRLTQCRGTQNGHLQWAIMGHYQVDGGEVRSITVAGDMAPTEPALPSITLERRGDLEMWFQNTGRWGCNAYDSNFGSNYHFDVN